MIFDKLLFNVSIRTLAEQYATMALFTLNTIAIPQRSIESD